MGYNMLMFFCKDEAGNKQGNYLFNLYFRAAVKPHPGGIPKKERQAYKEIQHLKSDKATYYKVLALQIRECMRVNNLSQKECAQALGLSSARVSQLVRIDKI